MTTGASTKSTNRLSTLLAVSLLCVAIVAWGAIFFWQQRKSPAQKHLEAGNEYARQGKSLEAVNEWQEAVKLDPKNAYAWQVLGQSYYSAGMWRRAIEAFIHLQKLQPETPHINSLLASSFFRIGDVDSTLKYGQEELRRNPDDIPSLEACAAAYTRLGQALEQRRCLQRLTDLQPEKKDSLIALAEVVINDHDFAQGQALADRIIKLDPNNPVGYAMRGICTFSVDGTPAGMSQAAADLQNSIRLHPEVYYCHLYLGKIYSRQGQTEKAFSEFTTAMQLKPEKADAYFDLAKNYERIGKTDQAEAMRRKFKAIAQVAEQTLHLKKKCELNPEDFDLQLKVGLMVLQQGDLASATRYIQRASKLRPNAPEVQTALERLASTKTDSNFTGNMPAKSGGE